jgi:hypothetical protein
MDDSSDGGDDESHGPGWSVVKSKRKKNGPAISAAGSIGSSCVETETGESSEKPCYKRCWQHWQFLC